jgi:hypothetical protein
LFVIAEQFLRFRELVIPNCHSGGRIGQGAIECRAREPVLRCDTQVFLSIFNSSPSQLKRSQIRGARDNPFGPPTFPCQFRTSKGASRRILQISGNHQDSGFVNARRSVHPKILVSFQE